MRPNATDIAYIAHIAHIAHIAFGSAADDYLRDGSRCPSSKTIWYFN